MPALGEMRVRAGREAETPCEPPLRGNVRQAYSSFPVRCAHAYAQTVCGVRMRAPAGTHRGLTPTIAAGDPDLAAGRADQGCLYPGENIPTHGVSPLQSLKAVDFTHFKH